MRRSSTWTFLPAFTIFLLGCQTNQPGATAPKSNAVSAYPSRPNEAASQVKVFHKTTDSLTLITDEKATDAQIEALVWQLRDAAHAHTLDKLGAGMAGTQAFVDKNKPTTWFHLYRGTKCAAEKYAAGNPPCGGSYHAAADYTFGTPGNANWDQGTLLHHEKETLLWDPDAPYSAKP